MKRMTWVVALAVAVIAQIASAGERGGIGIAPKIWFADPGKIKFLTMNEMGPESTMAGLQLTYDLNDNCWLSGLWMQGEFDGTFRDTRTTEDQSVRLETAVTLEETDAEIILGRTFKHADLGVGLRYSEFVREFSAEGSYLREQYGVTSAEGSADNSVLGPMLYLGLGGPFGESPMGWYAGTSVLVLDLSRTTTAPTPAAKWASP